MTCGLPGPKQLPEPQTGYIILNCTFGIKFLWNLSQHTSILNFQFLIEEDGLKKNIDSYSMTAILSRPQSVKQTIHFFPRC